jgi:hypothetical protein
MRFTGKDMRGPGDMKQGAVTTVDMTGDMIMPATAGMAGDTGDKALYTKLFQSSFKAY